MPLQKSSRRNISNTSSTSTSSVLYTPKIGSFNSIKNLASKISRFTPSRMSGSNSSSSRVASDSLSHAILISTPAAPQKAKAGCPNVKFMSGISSLTFNAPKPQTAALEKTIAGTSKVHTTQHTVPKPIITRGQKQPSLHATKLGNPQAASKSIEIKKPQKTTLHTGKAITLNNTSSLDTSKAGTSTTLILSKPVGVKKLQQFALNTANSLETYKTGANTTQILSEPIGAQELQQSTLNTTQVNTTTALDAYKVGTKNTIHSVSVPGDTQRLPKPTLQATAIFNANKTGSTDTEGTIHIISKPTVQKNPHNSTIHTANPENAGGDGGTGTKNTIRIVSEPSRIQKLHNISDANKAGSTDTGNAIHAISRAAGKQKSQPSAQVDLANSINTASINIKSTTAALRIVSEQIGKQKLQKPALIGHANTLAAATIITKNKSTSHVVSEPARKQTPPPSAQSIINILTPAKVSIEKIQNISHIAPESSATQKSQQPSHPKRFKGNKIEDTHANNILQSYSESTETKKLQLVSKIDQADSCSVLNTAKEKKYSNLVAAEAFNVGSSVSINSIDLRLFDITPIRLSPLSEDKVACFSNHNESDTVRSSIEQDDHERKHIFSTRDWLNQKRRQFSSVQTPCPGDGTDDLMSLDNHDRTFPSVRKFANKMARILPANRRERGGTLRHRTPKGGWKALSPFPTTIGSSPSPYRMNLSPLTPGSCYVVRNASQLELFNTINAYVAEAEKEREESKRRSDELADVAEELLILGEKERGEWEIREKTLQARIQELEQEVMVLKERVVTEKGEDHLGVQGANPITGVWSDLEEEEGVGKGKGKGRKGGKGRGRWRRTESSWALGPSESSTGTIIRNPPDNREAVGPLSLGSIIRNIHIHHHHHWRVARTRRAS